MAEVSTSLVPDAQLFRDAFNASPIGIAVENLDGQPLFVNPAFCKFLGFTEEELRKKHCVDFSPREDAEKDWALFQQLKAGSIDHYQMEKRYFRRDGSLVWGSLSISLMKGRSSPLVLAMVEDITEKKTAEEARFRLAAVVESADDAIVTKTVDGIITSWNESAQRMYGYTEAEAVGKPISIIVPSELSDEEKKILETLRAGGRIEHLETIRVTKTGKRINVSLTLSPIKDSSGRTLGSSGIARDITERKQAEKTLRESEEQFRTLAEAIPQLCWMARADGYVFWYNKRWYTYTGTTPEQMEGWGWQLVHDPQTLPSVLQRWKAAISTGEPSGMIFPLRGADGVFRPFLTRVMPIKDAEGRVVRWFGTDTDITELRDAQEALRVSEERLRLAQWAAHIGTFDLNIRTGVDIWQPETEALYGLPSGGFGGTLAAFEDLIHPDDRPRVTELTQEMMRTGQPAEAEWRVRWPDGSVHWIAGRGQVLMDESGKPSRMLGVNMDVTDRKQTEERLREYEKAVEGAEEFISIFDREYRCLMANRAYLKRRKLAREQVVGRFAHEFLDKKIYETVIKPKLDQCLQGKVVRHELKYTYPELGERDLLASYYPIGGGNGVDRIACVLQDITDRKLTEAALADVSRKLIEAQEQERTRIGSELHDDIGQRLALLAIELQQLHQTPNILPEVRRRMGKLHKRISEIATDIQSLSHQLHSAKLQYLGIAPAMRGFCQEFGEQQRMQIDYRHDVRSILPPEIGLCLFRVLQEALHNAAKHSGVKRIEAQIHEESGEIHLIVSDSGRGFDVEAVKHGKGLGLTSMRERVRLVNGTISIESKPMTGTTIHVRVPLESENHLEEREAV